MSGASNVNFWLKQHGIPSNPELVAAILNEAKKSPKLLEEEQIRAIAKTVVKA